MELLRGRRCCRLPCQKSDYDEYGQSLAGDADKEISSQVGAEQRHSGTQWNRNDLMPDWAVQRKRCAVPCQNAIEYEWLRAGPITTLGELFQHLGTEFTAKEIYAFYRTLRLVVLKRKKDAARPKEKPGSASGSVGSSVLGITRSALQARAMRAETKKQRTPTNLWRSTSRSNVSRKTTSTPEIRSSW